MKNDKSIMSGKGENDTTSGNTKLPFGLCKKYGIMLPNNATPKIAWEALKRKTGKGPEYFYEKAKNCCNVKTRKEAERYLSQKGILIDTSMNKMPNELFVSLTNKFLELDNKFGVATKGLVFEMNDIQEFANTNISIFTGNAKKITFSTNFFSSKEKLIAQKEFAISLNFSTKVANDQIINATLIHEYGHILFAKVLNMRGGGSKIEEYLKHLLKSKLSRKEITKEISLYNLTLYQEIVDEIFNIACKEDSFDTIYDEMSINGNLVPVEWLAEAFCNAYGGAPNKIGRATQKYLEEMIGNVK